MSATPARRSAKDAQVGDIVQSARSPHGALWRVTDSYPYNGHKRLDIRSLSSGMREHGRPARSMVIVSPEEVTRIQAKRAPKSTVSDATYEAVAEAIALWDYKTATGEDPDSDESIVLPPHREIAGKVIRIVTGVAA